MEETQVKFRYLTFDCYGTLVDWREGIASALTGIRMKSGLGSEAILRAYVDAEKEEEAHYQKYRDVLRKTAIGLSAKLGVDIGQQEALEFASSVPKWPIFPDTKGFLRRMGEEGRQRYILSNVDTEILEETISKNGLEVDGYVTAEEVGSYKPQNGHWLKFMAKAGAAKEETLHVAQSLYHDILPTQELGIASAWVNRYADTMPAAAQPMFISDSLDNLGAALEAEA